MLNRVSRFIVVLVLVAAIPAAAHAQFGRLKQMGKDMLEKKAGLKPDPSKPKQWKKGERVAPFDAAELDAFIKAWSDDLTYNSLSDAERERLSREAERKSVEYDSKVHKYEACVEKAMSPEEAMELQMEIAQKAVEESDGKSNPSVKAASQMQKAFEQRIEKKCGKKPKAPAGVDRQPHDYKMEEWVTAYLAVREESDAETAAEIVLASESEAELLEARLPQLRRLAKGQPVSGN